MNALSCDRREFMKVAVLSSCLPLIPNLGLAGARAEERTSWYRDAKFGMFIHWGPYSLASVEASWPIMTPQPDGISEAEHLTSGVDHAVTVAVDAGSHRGDWRRAAAHPPTTVEGRSNAECVTVATDQPVSGTIGIGP